MTAKTAPLLVLLAWLPIAALAIGAGYGLPNPSASMILAQHAPPHRRGLFFSIKQTGVPIPQAIYGYQLEKVTAKEKQLIDDPNEFADTEVVIVDGGEYLPHQVIQHPLHGGQNNAHSCFRRQGEKKERRL